MKKKLIIVLLLIGLGCMGYGQYNVWKANNNQKDSLIQAEQFINKEQSKSNDNPPDKFEFNTKIGDEIGLLLIPEIDATLPIIEGVSENELEKGVGHYNGTVFPSEPGQIVLSGHRDTVFRRMGELKIGDELTVRMPYGDFTYVMEKTEIVSADDLTVIRPHEYNEEILTVTTCYPFNYIGDAPDRYIIYAKPKSKTENDKGDS